MDSTRKIEFKRFCKTPGMIIERITIDWGGLKKTYVGPIPFEI
jgi:hypothetical protein